MTTYSYFQPYIQYCALLLASLSIFYHLLIRRSRPIHGGAKKLPEPDGAWPIIGHILAFGPHDLWYRKLSDMADKVGPVFAIRLGKRFAVVINNWELAKECFTSSNDKTLASRPTSLHSKYMGYNGAMFGFATEGPYLREVRKLITQELFSNKRLQALNHLRVSEIDLMIKRLKELSSINNKSGDHQARGYMYLALGYRPRQDTCRSAPAHRDRVIHLSVQAKKTRRGRGLPLVSKYSQVLVELDPWLRALTLNVTLRNIAGKRYYYGGDESEKHSDVEAKRWRDAFDNLIHTLRAFTVSELFPGWEFIDLMMGVQRGMRKASKDMDLLLSGWLEEHRMEGRSVDGEEDFVDVMINIDRNAKLFSEHDVDSVVKATCLDILIAARDTTSITLLWVITMLLNNPQVLKKVKEELDNQIGKDRHADEEDIKHLPYLQAVVKETLRLYPPSPLSLPHEASNDCIVGGFHVPKGATLITNIWKIQRDPSIWPDPLEFKPERFLTKNALVDFRGLHYELLPFGSGRRMCVGTNLAAHIVHLTLARLFHEFEIETPNNAPIDMTEAPDTDLVRASPLSVLIRPRE
ncbi:hypothetical protein Syun_004930 [Stephania yunnanensis]|uniref:Cytochrome P450 n=1 Tax=Stephania yunnanensis TaxID=152371 RepID=A0AAP0L5C9_9MAGN